MKKAELIRNIAKTAGVPDSETKLFFEIFLKRLSEILKPGHIISLKQFGYFAHKKARLVSKAVTNFDEQPEVIILDLIIHSDKKDFGNNISELLVFSIPSRTAGTDQNIIDSYFSLSLGKPVIPSHGTKPDGLFIPPSGIELRRLIESKVDKLIKEIETVDTADNPEEIISLEKSGIDPDQFTFEWEDSASVIDNILDSKEEISEIYSDSDDFENLSWDFGEQLAREIEEEAILNYDSETDDSSKGSAEILNWDFDSSEEKRTEKPEISEPQRKISDQDSKKIKENLVHKPLSDEGSSKPEVEKIGSFQRVKSLTRELTEIRKHDPIPIDETKEEQSASTPGLSEKPNLDNEIENKESVSEDPFDKYPAENFSQTTEYFITEDDEKNTGHEHPESSLEPVKESSFNNETPEVPPPSVQEKPKEQDVLNSALEEAFKYANKKREIGYDNRSRKTATIVFGSAMLLLAIVLIIYFYNRISGNDSADTTKLSSVNTVERNYDIPVTYPYPPKESTGEQTTVTEEPVQTPVTNESEGIAETTGTELPQLGELTSVRPNIYSDGQEYVVQVASFSSRNDADRQANVFKQRGYNVYIELADIPGRGTWHRVRVRGFKQLSEADKFYTDFIRNNR